MAKRFTELKQRASLAWKVMTARDGNLVSHAQRELAGQYASGDKTNIAMADHLVDMVRAFSAEGHSGFSASYARGCLSKLLAYLPLGPLTGEPTEWNHVGDEDGVPLYQNNRCGHVFRNGDAQAYDADGVVFEEPNGARFTGFHSRVPVTFPYTPKTVTAQVGYEATADEKRAAALAALAGA